MVSLQMAKYKHIAGSIRVQVNNHAYIPSTQPIPSKAIRISAQALERFLIHHTKTVFFAA